MFGTIFGKKTKIPPRSEELLAPLPPVVRTVFEEETKQRPCYVKGRKAIFHRWANTANPCLPKGVEPEDEKARYFQYRSVQAIVEYMDGSVDRVWPQELKFADGGRFDEMTWLPRGKVEG